MIDIILSCSSIDIVAISIPIYFHNAENFFIFLYSNKHLNSKLDYFIKDLKDFRELIKKNNLEDIFNLLKQTKVIRKSILKANKLKR